MRIIPIMNRQSTRKLLLAIEFLLLFFGLPLTFYFHSMPLPKFSVLISLSFFTGCYLISKRHSFSFRLRKVIGNSHTIHSIAFRTVVLFFFSIVLLLILKPDSLFYSPKNNLLQWIATALTYPFFSALPQEILFRAFFFQRYQCIFENQRTALLLNVLSFSFLHIIYANIIAIILTCAGGYFLCSTYQKTGSLLITTIEHTLYGYTIFTVGIGNFYLT